MSTTPPERELEKIELENSVNDTLEMFPIWLKSIAAQTKLMRGYYNQLIKSGFTEQQAFELVKAHGCFPPMNAPSSKNE